MRGMQTCIVCRPKSTDLKCLRQTTIILPLFLDKLNKLAPERLNQSGFLWCMRSYANDLLLTPESRQITMPAARHSIFFLQTLLFLTLTQQCQSTKVLKQWSLWPPYVIGGALYFCPVISIVYRLFFSSPNLSGRRLDVYHTLTHSVALVRI